MPAAGPDRQPGTRQGSCSARIARYCAVQGRSRAALAARSASAFATAWLSPPDRSARAHGARKLDRRCGRGPPVDPSPRPRQHRPEPAHPPSQKARSKPGRAAGSTRPQRAVRRPASVVAAATETCWPVRRGSRSQTRRRRPARAARADARPPAIVAGIRVQQIEDRSRHGVEIKQRPQAGQR